MLNEIKHYTMKHNATKTYRGVEVQLHTLTSVLDGGEYRRMASGGIAQRGLKLGDTWR
jgi:hypothetical protein